MEKAWDNEKVSGFLIQKRKNRWTQGLLYTVRL